MKKAICGLLFSMFVLGAAVRAGELTGKWSGSFQMTKASGETEDDTAYMVLKEDHGAVTGTAGPHADRQWTVEKGKLDGKKLSFELHNEDGSHLIFDLTFDGDEIQGTCSGTDDDGGKVSAKLHLTRTSD